VTRAPEPLDFTQIWPGEAAIAGSGRNDDSTDPDGMALALDIVAIEDESDGASASDAPPSPSPRPGSAMSMLLRRSATPTGTLLSHTFPWEDTQSMATPHPIYRYTASDEDALDVLEERHRTLMGEIASIEGRVGAMKRRGS